MGAKAEGSVFWALFLVLFPVAVGLPSRSCVNYKHEIICGLKGSSVVMSCSYLSDVTVLSADWFKLKPKPLDMTAYEKIGLKNNSRTKNCSMKLTNLTKNDDSTYYVAYNYSRTTGDRMIATCNGGHGVKLRILVSPVIIIVEDVVSGKKVYVTHWTAYEGQRIRLNCVPNCAANLTFNPGYIWYKNRQRINDSNESSLSLHPVNPEDEGRYVCTMIGYEDFPSHVLNLKVQNGPRDAVAPSDKGINPVPEDISFTPVYIVVVGSVSTGWFITMTVTIVLISKRKWRRGCAGSTPGAPNPSNPIYTDLLITSISRDYDRLDAERCSSAADTVYENLLQPQSHIR